MHIERADPISLPHPNIHKEHFRSFEDVYKASYSHGLENIYNIETIDLKTVRRLNDHSRQPTPQALDKPRLTALVPSQAQLEFDLGDSFRESMDSFVLDEPIQVLGLSKHADRSLNEHGMHTLRDLLKADLSQFIYLKGMGQGHIDEIEQKLSSYNENRILFRSTTIDFSAWIRSLITLLNNKKMYVALEPYDLSKLCTLSLADNVEVRRLNTDKRNEWRHEIMMELSLKKSRVHADMKKISEVYILPWMRRRLGFATKQEMIERLQRVSDSSAMIIPIFNFFTDIYFSGKFPFEGFFENNEDLFFANQDILNDFYAIINKAKTYFYKSGITYTLNELVILLNKEFGYKWLSFPDGFIEKCLRASSCFRVRKTEDHHLTIRSGVSFSL